MGAKRHSLFCSILAGALCLVAVASNAASNALATSPSPYLQMHAEDPIHWQTWSAEVMDRARRENKLVFVSIGYFSCHWCHVMHRESFRDAGIGKLLNQDFIAVKVDRELNPGLDAQLLEFVQATRGRAGWPLNVILTPEGHPLVGGTYLPKERFGGLLTQVQGYWHDDAARLRGVAAAASEMLREHRSQGAKTVLDEAGRAAIVAAFRHQLTKLGDALGGGFGEQSKFPSVPQLKTLLRLVVRDGRPEERGFLALTLHQMARLGMRDHIAGGFFRYVTDPDWETPHFEKMLYDNAQLIELYARASGQFAGPVKKEFEAVAIDTAHFLLREMRNTKGGFVSSLSAVDSAGEEGEPYWLDAKELTAAVPAAALPVVRLLWGFDRPAPSPSGYHLIDRHTTAEIAARLGLSEAQVTEHIASARAAILKARDGRRVPQDVKRLASWNGLALSALAQVARLDPKGDMQAAAKGLRDYLVTSVWDGKRLVRMQTQQAGENAAGLRDYVFLARGLLDWAALGTNPAVDKLDRQLAVRLLAYAQAHFYDASGWRLSEASLLADSPAYVLMADGALPSATAVWAEAVLRAAREDQTKNIDAQALDGLVTQARAMVQTDVVALREAAFFHATHIALLLEDG